MDYAEARHQILLHGPGTTDATGQPLVLEDGFLGSLRPYRGLHEKNFHLLMEALLSVGEQLHRDQPLDREIVFALWSICHTARGWGLDPNGMLQRNHLIKDNDIARLEHWVGILEIVALRLLRGWSPRHAVYYYAEYVVSIGWWDNAAFYVGLMSEYLSDPDLGESIETITQALTKLGSQAGAALPSLRQAEQREYSIYTPADHCTAEVRSQIRNAIQAIEGANAPR